MTTTPEPGREPTLQDLADKLDQLSIKLAETQQNLGSELAETRQNLGFELAEARKGLGSELAETRRDLEQTQKWQDRTWDVVKWVGGISAGLSISAAIALVGIVLRLAFISGNS